MGKTIICCTLKMSTVIIVLYSCMVTTCMCTVVCIGVSKNLRLSAAHVHKEPNLVWPDPFLELGIYRLQYKHHTAAKALSMVVMLLYVLNYLAGPQLHVADVTFS